jgi:hypothetical protein
MEFAIGACLTLLLVALFSFCIFVLPMILDVLEQRRFRREIDASDQILEKPPNWSEVALRRQSMVS